MHIMPEQIETWSDLPRNEGKEVFPLPELLMFFGYTLILILDKVLFDTATLFTDNQNQALPDPADQKFNETTKTAMSRSQQAQQSDDPNERRKSLVEEKQNMEGAMKDLLNPNDRFATRMKASLSKDNKPGEVGDEQQQMFVENTNIALSNDGKNNVRGSFAKTKKDTSCCPGMTPYILMIALSVHSIFEGLALGLTKDEGDLINIVIAILVHKGAASLSLGISLIKTFPTDFWLCRKLILLFSFATPLGVFIGMLVANAGDIYEVIFNSVAAGTFLYIACSEVIIEEFSVPGARYWKLLAYILGAMTITLLWFLDS